MSAGPHNAGIEPIEFDRAPDHRGPGWPVNGALICRTLADVYAAADADSANDRPLTQAQADYTAALLAAHLHQDAA